MVLFRQMQKEFIELWKRRTQAQMDIILRQRRERKSINRKKLHLFSPNQSFFHILHEDWTQAILMHITLEKNCLTDAHDVIHIVKTRANSSVTIT